MGTSIGMRLYSLPGGDGDGQKFDTRWVWVWGWEWIFSTEMSMG